MAIVIKQKLVCEDILNENGEKIGEIKFNPNDSRIMSRLSNIVKKISQGIKDLNNLGDMPEISKEQITNIEDFEKISKDIDKLCQGYEIEENVSTEAINELVEIFGEDTINAFTSGSKDIELLMPLLDFVMPYVEEARNKQVSKYIPKKDELEVFE